MSHICHADSQQVGKVWAARENSLETLHQGWEMNSDHREDRQGDAFILSLSYYDLDHVEEQTVRLIRFPV